MPDAQPNLADMVIEDMERQLSEPDPRYGRKCRELAVIRAQYTQLMEFVRSKKDELGLTEVGPDGEPLETEEGKLEGDAVVNTGEAAEKPETPPRTNGKTLPKEPAKG